MFDRLNLARLSAIAAAAALVIAAPAWAVPSPIAGVDFNNGSGGFDITPDDLDLGDGITVSTWSLVNGASITNDGNAQTGRPAFTPVGKFNGQDGLAQPSVGAAPPANNIHSFSITIPAGNKFDLTDVSFVFSQATGTEAGRWLAFKTSLDANLIFSQVGALRPAFTPVTIPLAGAQYKGLENQVVTFQWYAGGGGTGDIDIDSIVIQGMFVPVPEPATATLGLLGLAGMLARRRRIA